MQHWRNGYLGIRQVPRDLGEFELSTFFTFSKQEIALIETRRSDLYRLGVALQIGFIRMSGRVLDSYRQIPSTLWRHIAGQLGVQPPDLGTLRSIYDGRFDTLSDHQRFARVVANFRTISEHQRRYVIQWLKEQLTGRPERGDLGNELKQWFYEHRIIIPTERTLRLSSFKRSAISRIRYTTNMRHLLVLRNWTAGPGSCRSHTRNMQACKRGFGQFRCGARSTR